MRDDRGAGQCQHLRPGASRRSFRILSSHPPAADLPCPQASGRDPGRPPAGRSHRRDPGQKGHPARLERAGADVRVRVDWLRLRCKFHAERTRIRVSLLDRRQSLFVPGNSLHAIQEFPVPTEQGIARQVLVIRGRFGARKRPERPKLTKFPANSLLTANPSQPNRVMQRREVRTAVQNFATEVVG